MKFEFVFIFPLFFLFEDKKVSFLFIVLFLINVFDDAKDALFLILLIICLGVELSILKLNLVINKSYSGVSNSLFFDIFFVALLLNLSFIMLLYRLDTLII